MFWAPEEEARNVYLEPVSDGVMGDAQLTGLVISHDDMWCQGTKNTVEV